MQNKPATYSAPLTLVGAALQAAIAATPRYVQGKAPMRGMCYACCGMPPGRTPCRYCGL